MAGYLQSYKTPGIDVTPAFEIITTVADSKPGEDGNYSRLAPKEIILPWILEARQKGAYVILDLQPGRNDFLSQAKKYEELLKYENVGLALDPEWRLGPDEFHLRQIGSVDATEVNEVVDWLANLVRENHLPQKLLILHQFRVFMVRNRSTVKAPMELSVMVHMDGSGTLEEKLGTYDLVAVQFPNEPERSFGWKNFFSRDSQTAKAATVLSLNPLPDYVSYQ